MAEKITDFRVNREEELLPFLMRVLNGISRNSAKSFLYHRQIKVNGAVETKYNRALVPGDTVRIDREKQGPVFQNKLLTIVYEDDYLFVVNKREGLLSVGTETQKDRTAHHLLNEYGAAYVNPFRVYIVHRLDKDTSGLMLFAKSEEIKLQLQHNWNNVVTDRRYVALLEGEMIEKREGTITSWLRDNKAHITYSSDKDNGGDIATTHYNVVETKNGYTLAEFTLDTGRKNQIRVHAKELGFPVVGDKKYGNGLSSKAGRLCLHAFKLTFIHPVTNQELTFQTPYPEVFLKVLNKEI